MTSSFSLSAADCRAVNGYNLCDDAKIIAQNEAKQIGQNIPGAEYVLQSVHSENMTVFYEYKSIYTERQVAQMIGESSLRDYQNKSFKTSCAIFTKRDPFIRDGGIFVMKYLYKDGGHIHTNTISVKNCE